MPEHNDYFPLRVGDQIPWLKNWRNRIGTYQTVGGYASGDITGTVGDADFIVQLIESWTPAIRSFSEAATAYQKLILFGPVATVVVAVPVFTGNPVVAPPPAPSWPSTVPPGALKRIFAFVKNMKTRAFYTEAVGQDLQVIGGVSAHENRDTVKPEITAARRGDEVRIGWRKGAFDGVEIWVDRGSGTFVKLAVDMTPDYFDTEPLPATAQTWKYKARYLLDDAPVGQFSHVVEFLAKA